MRILFVAPRYHPHVGGVEYVVKSVAERLAKGGHEVNVLCGDERDRPSEEEVNGVAVVRWPVRSPGGAYHVPMMRGALERRLLDLAKGCDVVHFHSAHSVLTMYALRALKKVGARKVLTLHYHGTGHTPLRRLLWLAWRPYVRGLVKHVDVVHAVSGYEAQLIARSFGVKPVVIEHGVEEWLSQVEWNPSGFAMYSGRIERYKNVHRLANIVKILNDMGLELALKVFGEGSYKSKLKQHLDRLGIEYELNPPQPYEEYIKYLSRAAFLGLLSEKEAYGQTVNEANAIGVPAVVAEPWCRSFEGRSRTLIVDLEERDVAIAERIAKFLEESAKQPKSPVPSWSQVVNMYAERLYESSREGLRKST